MMMDEISSQLIDQIHLILPVIYTVLTLIGLIGNTINFYALYVTPGRCNRKSIHVLLSNLMIEGTIWTIVFYIVKMVSYIDSVKYMIINNDQWLTDSWCQLETYILRIMDFILAYTLVFLCLDRCIKRKTCVYGQHHFKYGIYIVVSLWLTVCYALIPILFFKKELRALNYDSYECVYNSTEIDQLIWFDLKPILTPYQTICLIDFIFGNALPILLMIVLPLFRFFIHKNLKMKKYKIGTSYNLNDTSISTYKNLDSTIYSDEDSGLIKMVVLYVILYIICQLPYYIYRLILINHPSIESNLRSKNILYVIDTLLIILRLTNRAINPWLSVFFVRSIRYSSRRVCLSFWCCNFFPCCPHRWSCLRDCSLYIHHEWSNLRPNADIIREIRPTGNTKKKEFIDSSGKHIMQIYEEYVRYYHRPRSQFTDVNPALLYAGRSTSSVSDYLSYLTGKNNSELYQIRTEL